MNEVLVKKELPRGLNVTSAAPLVLTLVALVPGVRGIWIAFDPPLRLIAPYTFYSRSEYFQDLGLHWIYYLGGSVFLTFLVYMTARFALVYLPLEFRTRNLLSFAIVIVLTLASLWLVRAQWDASNEVRELGISSGLLVFGAILYVLTCIALIAHGLLMIWNFNRLIWKTSGRELGA